MACWRVGGAALLVCSCARAFISAFAFAYVRRDANEAVLSCEVRLLRSGASVSLLNVYFMPRNFVGLPSSALPPSKAMDGTR